MQCAVRETYEEIGLTLGGLLSEKDYIEVQHGGLFGLFTAVGGAEAGPNNSFSFLSLVFFLSGRGNSGSFHWSC